MYVIRLRHAQPHHPPVRRHVWLNSRTVHVHQQAVTELVVVDKDAVLQEQVARVDVWLHADLRRGLVRPDRPLEASEPRA